MSVRHDWYQTEEKVVISVMLKNPTERNCKVTIEENRVLVEADDYNLELHLCDSINAEKSTYKFSAVKVEIVLAKLIGKRWPNLTKEVESNPTVINIYKKDWEAIAKGVEKEKAEGDEAVNELFQKIYNDSSPDVRRAMNKSFSESNGTVLSTNWKDVGSQKTETKPPEGTEFIKWKDS